MSAAQPRKRHPVLRSLAAVAAAAVLLISITGYAAARRYDSKITRVALGGVLGTERGADVDPGEGLQSMNVLLVGIDNRDGLTRQQLNEWHLGHADRKYWPNQRGFDHFYGNVVGEVDYFTKEIGRAHV